MPAPTASITVHHASSFASLSSLPTSPSRSALNLTSAITSARNSHQNLRHLSTERTMLAFNDRLLHALLTIHATPARLINPGGGGSTAGVGDSDKAGFAAGGQPATPGAGPSGSGATVAADASRRKASVAIIIRIRPSSSSALPASPVEVNLDDPRSSSVPHPSWREHHSATTNSGSDDHSGSPKGYSTSPPAGIGAGAGVGAASSSGSATAKLGSEESMPEKLRQFFAQEWVREGTPEVLFIKRASRSSDRWSAHIAFPGGRQEPDDEGRLYTAMRETWEEVGVDLAEKEYLPIGQLDDREITTSLGKRLLMVLSPFVFLHTSPHTPQPELQPSEVASAHWIPLMLLHSPHVRWGDVVIDISSRLAPRSPIIKAFLRILVGNMHFKCVLLPNEPIAIGQESPDDQRGGKRPDLKLWGLTLGMTLDLISHMSTAAPPSGFHHSHPATYPFLLGKAAASAITPSTKTKSAITPTSPFLSSTPPISHIAPSMTSIFPRFSYPDINFFIFLFSWRYRALMKRWMDRPGVSANSNQPVTPGSGRDRTVNWAGMALGQFYAAVRRALVVAILLRASVAVGGLAWLGYWITKRVKGGRALLKSAR